MKNTITENAMSVSLAKDLVYSIPYGTKFNRIRSMNAYTTDAIEIDGNYYRFLKSYNTIVGIVDYGNNTFTEFGKYSVTTSKQVTVFYRALPSCITREFNPNGIYARA